jgi:transcriptional regulator with XRE-family HTH domain
MDCALNSTSSKGLGRAPETPAGPHLVHQTGDIGQLVRVQRKKQGLRIDDAAAFTHVSVDLLSRLENGKGSIGLEKVLSVLDGLGLCLVVSPRNDPLLRELLRASPSGTEKQNP